MGSLGLSVSFLSTSCTVGEVSSSTVTTFDLLLALVLLVPCLQTPYATHSTCTVICHVTWLQTVKAVRGALTCTFNFAGPAKESNVPLSDQRICFCTILQTRQYNWNGLTFKSLSFHRNQRVHEGFQFFRNLSLFQVNEDPSHNQVGYWFLNVLPYKL